MRSASLRTFLSKAFRRVLWACVAAALLLGSAVLVDYAINDGERLLAGEPRIVDGDTIEVDGVSIRLSGFDAPERAQTCKDRRGETYACGRFATEYLTFLIGEGIAACRSRGRDRYGRTIGLCRASGRDLGSEMVRRGWAVSYRGDYAEEEGLARRAEIGLWAGEFQRPDEWRRERRRASVLGPLAAASETLRNVIAISLGRQAMRAPDDG